GNEIIHGSYDECSYNFLLPYYKQEIEAPPSLFATGGRFNRSGTSYLYLSDTIETCLAEVHLPIGQNCSVGEFRCAEQIELIDLTQFKNDSEMENWLKILMQPVYTETKYIYNITRFLADIFKSINGNGMYFESVQAEGHNIVCFNPFLFKLVEYSEKIFTATKIKYDYQQVEDAIREYSRNGEYKYINSYNENENRRNEEKIDYLYDWIENEKRK
ncbi:MAG: RES family NAD+ phosphorylase, partial [Oscillospiraceae bacterium]|nr:RES family NAD+ phosphorylase [Oscillospiraceae bacterium]